MGGVKIVNLKIKEERNRGGGRKHYKVSPDFEDLGSLTINELKLCLRSVER